MVTYKESGVDIRAADELIRRLKKRCPEIGGFGGLYPLGDSYLVAGTDGVGTKLKLAFDLNQHDTIGIDLVAMCVNDIITTGAKPLFFLDYFATSKLDVDQAELVLSGILKGCSDAGCVLLGGETAEMPGFYKEDEYDVSGFAVGIVPKEDLIDASGIGPGDALVGIRSSGFHSNGFSLVRKVLEGNPDLLTAKELLTPTKIYVKQIQEILDKAKVKGMAHITGGGFQENIPRVLPEGCAARIWKSSWEVPELFRKLQNAGEITEEEMFHTFNMGIGMLLVMEKGEAEKICEGHEDCLIIGEVSQGKGVLWS